MNLVCFGFFCIFESIKKNFFHILFHWRREKKMPINNFDEYGFLWHWIDHFRPTNKTNKQNGSDNFICLISYSLLWYSPLILWYSWHSITPYATQCWSNSVFVTIKFKTKRNEMKWIILYFIRMNRRRFSFINQNKKMKNERRETHGVQKREISKYLPSK